MRRREHLPRLDTDGSRKHQDDQPETWLTHEMRVFLSFWVFGCLATMQFVVVVTAANDLVGNQAPPGLILFAYTLPSVLIRAFVPYIRFPTIRLSTVIDGIQDLCSGRRGVYSRLEKRDDGDNTTHHTSEHNGNRRIHHHNDPGTSSSSVSEKEVNYALRLTVSAMSSFTGLQLLSFSQSLALRVLGISLTSLSSNLGDMSFYQLATRYPISMTQSLGGYAAGSGAAGLIGSAVYTILTGWAGVETPFVLSGMGLVPIILLLVYGLLLPEVEVGPTGEEEELNSIGHTLEAGHGGSIGRPSQHVKIQDLAVRDKLRLVQPMVLGYMLPLATLMLLENTTIQGILPNSIFYLPLGVGKDGSEPQSSQSLLSPLFKTSRDFYPTYITVYQLAVFLGRTSINFVRLPNRLGAGVYWGLCVIELVCFLVQYGEGVSMTFSAADDEGVWFGPAGVMVIIALMGLCGGVGMSNTYWRASKERLPRGVWRVLADIKAKRRATLGGGGRVTSSADERRVWAEEDEMDGLLNVQGEQDLSHRRARAGQNLHQTPYYHHQHHQRGRSLGNVVGGGIDSDEAPQLTRSTSTYNRPEMAADARRTGSYLLRSRTNRPTPTGGNTVSGAASTSTSALNSPRIPSSPSTAVGAGIGARAPEFPFPQDHDTPQSQPRHSAAYAGGSSSRRSHSVGSTSYGTIETPPRRSTSSMPRGHVGGRYSWRASDDADFCGVEYDAAGGDGGGGEEKEKEREEEDAALREFLISTIALPDTLAIMLASVVSLWMQPRGCRMQVEGGRGLCVKAG